MNTAIKLTKQNTKLKIGITALSVVLFANLYIVVFGISAAIVLKQKTVIVAKK